jgi:hypothetical protein
MIMSKFTVEELAELVLTQQRERISREFSQRLADAETVNVRPGKKYTKIDRGPEHNRSGFLMIEDATGEIFGIKAYGVPHKGHRYGTLDTIDQWYWGDYGPRKLVTADPEAWPAGKTFGELTPEQKRAAQRRASDQLSAELTANADAIGKIMDHADADALAEVPAAEVPDIETARHELHRVSQDYLAGKLTRDEYQHAAASLNAAISHFLAAEPKGVQDVVRGHQDQDAAPLADVPDIPAAPKPEVAAYREIAGLHEHDHVTLHNLAGDLEVIVTSSDAGDHSDPGMAYAIGFERHTRARVHVTADDLLNKCYSISPRWHDDQPEAQARP